MRLLISVADADEADAALAGGADIIDAKNPASGALGPVSDDTLRAIRSRIPRSLPLSAALGEARSAGQVRTAVRSGRGSELAFVKFGFGELDDADVIGRLLAQAVVAAREVSNAPGIVAVAYADWRRARSLEAGTLIERAERSGAAGILIDTAFKDAGRLLDFYTLAQLGEIAEQAHACGLFLALGGGLSEEEVVLVSSTGADIAGVRGAACVGGRTGSLSEEKVRSLKRSMSAGN
ncbi:MAG: (5-formylfuran-3-yl)methyl phosphate synthase [Gemmatimonadota bacterium]